MASPTTGQLTTDVHVSYNTNGTVTTIPDSNKGNPLQFQQNERIKFIPDPQVEVYIQLNPTKPPQFDQDEFTPHIDGVTFIKASTPRIIKMYNCGFVQVVSGVRTGYGWLPADVKATVNYLGGSFGIWGEG